MIEGGGACIVNGEELACMVIVGVGAYRVIAEGRSCMVIVGDRA